MTRMLVTGGAGYIGSVVAAALADAGHDVVVVDNLSSGNAERVPTAAEFHRVAVGDTETLRQILSASPVDACFHFAGSFDLGASMSTPEVFFANNVGETLVLLRELIDHGVGRIVFSSSAAVYGEPHAVPIDESHPTVPVSPYGESKLLVEHALGWMSRLGRIRVASLRYFNAAGAVGPNPERHRPETHLIPLALAAAAGEREGLELFGDDYDTPDGTCIRDYIHVADLAAAHILAVEALERTDSFCCNLGTGTGSSNAEVLDAVREVTGRDFDVRVGPRRAGDPARLVASHGLATELLGWQPSHSSLQTIVADAWAALVAGAPATP